MRNRTRSAMAVAAVTIAAGAGLAGLAAPALASNAGTTVHMSVPFVDAGGSVSCGTTVLTPTGGTARFVFHESTDAQGIFHLTGTGTINQGTLQDTSGNIYSISGANWFGGKYGDNKRFFAASQVAQVRAQLEVRKVEMIAAEGRLARAAGLTE